MQKLKLTLEAGTAEIILHTGAGEPIIQALPALLSLTLLDGQHARINHLSGDELRVLVANEGDEVVSCTLHAEAGHKAEHNTLVPGALRDPGNSVVLHGWEGDYFVLGSAPEPVVEMLGGPVSTT